MNNEKKIYKNEVIMNPRYKTKKKKNTMQNTKT